MSSTLPAALSLGSAAESAPAPPGRISSGVEWLDIILRGGLPENRAFLIIGDPGSGKTTFGLQFLLEGVARGESALYVSLAETASEVAGVARSHGMDISKVEVFELGAAEYNKPEQDYTALHPAEVELGENLERILEAVARVRPKRVVIDSLTEIRLMAREPVRYRRQMIALKNALVQSGCTVIFIDDPTARGPTETQLQTICHGVICLERMAPEYGCERRRVRVMKMREVDFYAGYHDYTIVKGGLVIWPRLIASEHRREYAMEPVSSGVPELDTMIGGGPDRGTTMLAIGAAGVGKSSLCHQYCMSALARGEYFAWFSFDERVETIFKRAASMGNDFQAAMAAGKCSIEQVDPGSLSPGEFIQRVRRQVERFGAKIVVIDSLNGYLTAMPGERFLVIQMHELLNYMAQMGTLTLMVIAQHGLVGGVEASVDLSYLADTVTFLRYFEHAGQVRRAISVIKKRSSVHEEFVREFRVTPTGLLLGEPLHEFKGVLTGQPEYIGLPGSLLVGGREGERV